MRMPSKSRTRPFTIADGMILIAATALATAWIARAWRLLGDQQSSLADDVWGYALIAIIAALPFLVVWTMAMVVLSARKPRPVWWRASREPGASASLAAALSLVVSMPIITAIVLISVMRTRTSDEVRGLLPVVFLQFLSMAAPLVGFVVLMTWSLMGVQNGWRCKATWIDRLGRVLGFLWIVAGTISGAFWYRVFGP